MQVRLFWCRVVDRSRQARPSHKPKDVRPNDHHSHPTHKLNAPKMTVRIVRKTNRSSSLISRLINQNKRICSLLGSCFCSFHASIKMWSINPITTPFPNNPVVEVSAKNDKGTQIAINKAERKLSRSCSSLRRSSSSSALRYFFSFIYQANCCDICAPG